MNNDDFESCVPPPKFVCFSCGKTVKFIELEKIKQTAIFSISLEKLSPQKGHKIDIQFCTECFEQQAGDIYIKALMQMLNATISFRRAVYEKTKNSSLERRCCVLCNFITEDIRRQPDKMSSDEEEAQMCKDCVKSLKEANLWKYIANETV